MKQFLVFLLLFTHLFVLAQTPDVLRIREYRKQNEGRIIAEFKQFLTIPNIATDQVQIRKNAEFLVAMMRARGIGNVRLLEANSPGAPPSVYGEVMTPGATKTIMFYAHYDGQPVDSTQWYPGLHPFQPVLTAGVLGQGGAIMKWPEEAQARFEADWRIYARGSSDDKAGVLVILNAWEAIRQLGLKTGAHIRFFFEGEEEQGSPHLHQILEKYKDVLKADLWIFCDGPVHQSGRRQLVFGVRGDTHLELTVFGSRRPLHSGHYGNWAPNPAMQLSQLLASMKDESGRVRIRGFYDDVTPLSAAEQKALQDVPAPDAQMKSELGFIEEEMKGVSLTQAILMPSLNINGITSAGTGKYASNVIPTKAVASIDLRLVPGNDWKKQQDKVIAHIQEQGFHVTEQEPTEQERLAHRKLVMVRRSDGYNAQRTPLDMHMSQQLIRTMREATDKDIVVMPSLGGSLPLFLFEKYLATKIVTVPIANHDNNQHAENENIRIGNFWNGIEAYGAIMLMQWGR